jgi:transcription elongation factor Elf1
LSQRNPGYLLEAETRRGYIRRMAETFKCPHCGALYEIIAHERTVSDDKDVADCQVCGKRMHATDGSRILRYELVRMPDGTNV